MANPWPIEVKREHVALLHWIWIEGMRKHYLNLSLEDVFQAWGLFMECPTNPSLVNFKRAANELWLLYIQSN